MNPALPKKKLNEYIRKDGVNPALPEDWYYVYLLTSKMSKWIYTGCTNNLDRRLKEHSEEKVFITKKILPVDLIYFEAYKSKDYAYKREKSLKQYGSALAKLKSRIGLNEKGRAG